MVNHIGGARASKIKPYLNMFAEGSYVSRFGIRISFSEVKRCNFCDFQELRLRAGPQNIRSSYCLKVNKKKRSGGDCSDFVLRSDLMIVDKDGVVCLENKSRGEIADDLSLMRHMCIACAMWEPQVDSFDSYRAPGYCLIQKKFKKYPEHVNAFDFCREYLNHLDRKTVSEFESEPMGPDTHQHLSTQDLLNDLVKGNKGEKLRAIRLLGYRREVGAIEGFLEESVSGDEDVEKELEQALIRIGEPAVEPLILAFQHEFDKESEGPYISDFVWSTLKKIGYPAVPYLHDALKTEKRSVRYSVAFTLYEINDPRSLQAFIEALNDEDSNVKDIAKRYLTKQGETVIPSLLSVLSSADQRKRLEIEAIISKIKDKK